MAQTKPATLAPSTRRRVGGRDRPPRWRTVVPPLAMLVLILGLWEGAVRSGLIMRQILPLPSDVSVALGKSLIDIVTGGRMFGHFATTLIEILGGFSCSIVIGGTIAFLMSESRFVREAWYPYIVAFNATPTIAIAPLFIIWFGVGVEAKIILVITGATFPIIVSTIAGLLATSDEMVRLMRSMGATRWQIFRRVRLPSALPFFFSGLELAIVASSIGAIVGEFSGGNAGLGYVILLAQDTYNLPVAFATLIILAALGITLHRLVVLAQRRIVFWSPGSRVR